MNSPDIVALLGKARRLQRGVAALISALSDDVRRAGGDVTANTRLRNMLEVHRSELAAAVEGLTDDGIMDDYLQDVGRRFGIIADRYEEMSSDDKYGAEVEELADLAAQVALQAQRTEQD